MVLRKVIADLISLSSYAGKHPEFVQGGGGNCSVKFDEKMIIKASGFFLKDVADKKAFVVVDLQKGQPISNQKFKPSLEIGIHLLLGKYVIHTHPILVGVVVCAKQGRKFFKRFFRSKNFFWIRYANPGQQLAKRIKSLLVSRQVDTKKDIVLFLENHGIFVSSSNKTRCMELHENVIQSLKDFLGCKEPRLTKNRTKLLKNKYLTPDHVVYSNPGNAHLSNKQKKVLDELKIYSGTVKAFVKSINWDIVYLKKRDVDFILKMKGEKYRQELLRN